MIGFPNVRERVLAATDDVPAVRAERRLDLTADIDQTPEKRQIKTVSDSAIPFVGISGI